jgi:hypothetical protein
MISSEDSRAITRLWPGWTTHENADNYEELLKSEILPSIHRIAESCGATVLRCAAGMKLSSSSLRIFHSMESVKAFVGPDYEIAVVPPEARKLLSHFDHRSAHYEAVFKLEQNIPNR